MADKFTAEDRRALGRLESWLRSHTELAPVGQEEARIIKRLLAPGGPLDGVESDPEREAFEVARQVAHDEWSQTHSTHAPIHTAFLDGFHAGWQARAAREGGAS